MRFLSICALLVLPAFSGVRGDEVMYISGTAKGMPVNTEGHIFMPSSFTMQFLSAKGEILIPITKLTSAVYLEKNTSANAPEPKKIKVPGLPSFSMPKAFRDGKKRTLTLTFLEKDGTEQTLVFQLAKNMVAPMIRIIETHGLKEVALDPEGDYDVD